MTEDQQAKIRRSADQSIGPAGVARGAGRPTAGGVSARQPASSHHRRSPWTMWLVGAVAVCAFVPALVALLLAGVLAGMIVLVAAAVLGTGAVLVAAALRPRDDD
jgi:hypothetical protein